MQNKSPLKTRDDLSMAYTPGVARVCTAIQRDPDKAFQYTIKRNTVAVVSDGTAVLGLGDIGPRAAMPVMEGKAMLFKEFAGVDAFPHLPRHTRSRRDRGGGPGDRARLRRHQPRGHLRAALLRDRGPAEGRARHPGVPRRSARDRGRRPGGAAERADADRSPDRGHPDRDRRDRGRRGRRDADPARGRRAPHHRLRLARGAVRGRGPTTWTADASGQAGARGDTNLERRAGGACRRARRRRPVHRTVRRARDRGLGAGGDEPRPDRVRDGQPRPPRSRPRTPPRTPG